MTSSLPRRSAPLLATALLAGAVGTAAPAVAAPPAPPPPVRTAAVTTTQIVGEVRVPADGSRDAHSECRQVERMFHPTARSGRVYDMSARTSGDMESVEQDGVFQVVEVVSCRVRFLGPVAPHVVARDLRAAQARYPDWVLRAVPDRVHGAAFAFTLPRTSSDALLSTLLNRIGPTVGPEVRSSACGTKGGSTVLLSVSHEPVPSAVVARTQAAVARAAKLPTAAVKVRSPWAAGPPDVCLQPHYGFLR